MSPRGAIGAMHDQIRRLFLSWPHPLLVLGNLALPLLGHCSKSAGHDPHGRDGHNPHHKQRGTDLGGMGTGELALPPRLKQAAP